MADRFVVSARKYRPATFGELVGQEAISATLQRSIRQNKIAHAYLFCGPRGVGKTSAARIFAKTINCLELTPEGEACGHCDACRAFERQKSLSVYELDAASNNSTDDIRRLIEEVNVPPQTGKHKVYIIDEVHMLSKQAFNAFLKTLEEPPSYVVFILATTEKQMILPTILSRCQVYDFRPIPEDVIVRQLKLVAHNEQIPAEEEALAIIARHADGGMRDALSLFDRIAGFGDGQITYKQTVDSLHILDKDTFFQIANCLHRGDSAKLLGLLDEIYADGFDGKAIITGLSAFYRNLFLAVEDETLPIAQIAEVDKTAYVVLARSIGKPALYTTIAKLMDCERQYRMANGKRLLVEMTLLGLALSKELKSAVSVSNQPVTSSNQSAASSPQPTTPAPASSPSVAASPQQGATAAQPASPSGRPIARNPLTKGVVSLRSTEQNKKTEPKGASTPVSLLDAWADYKEHSNMNDPSRKFMNSLFPTMHKGGIVHFTVREEAQRETLLKEEQTLLGCLSKLLQKPLRLQVDVASPEQISHIHNPREWISDEIKKKPSLKKLFEELDLYEKGR